VGGLENVGNSEYTVHCTIQLCKSELINKVNGPKGVV
jgi:hypothetical protein